MSSSLYADLLSADGHEVPLEAGEYLFHAGDDIAALFLVRSGTVHLVRHQANGTALVLQRAGPGGIVAEASLLSPRYHCDAIAVSPARMKRLPMRTLRERFERDPAFAHAWANHLAREIQAARFRSEVIAMRTVASRLDAWLDWHGCATPPKGEWKHVAEQLGATPEALYRELSRRRRESSLSVRPRPRGSAA